MAASKERDILTPVWWALAADTPGGHYVGVAAVKLVLVALAGHANQNWEAWPGSYTLERDLGFQISRRNVQDALGLCSEAGLIKRVGNVGRSVKWLLDPIHHGGDITAIETSALSSDHSRALSSDHSRGNSRDSTALTGTGTGTRTSISPFVTRAREVGHDDVPTMKGPMPDGFRENLRTGHTRAGEPR